MLPSSNNNETEVQKYAIELQNQHNRDVKMMIIEREDVFVTFCLDVSQPPADSSILCLPCKSITSIRIKMLASIEFTNLLWSATTKNWLVALVSSFNITKSYIWPFSI